MIKFNSILKFIIKSAAIYINPMFTYYLIKVACGGDARVCACVAINLMIAGCQILRCWVAKYRRSSFTKSLLAIFKLLCYDFELNFFFKKITENFQLLIKDSL